jgi:molecular chaperone GrpE
MKKKNKVKDENKKAKHVEAVEETAEATEKETVKETKKIKTPEEQVLELKDSLLRKVAEFDNFRKRKAKDMQDARFNATCGVIESFLTVYDHFKMAMTSVENGDSLEIVQQGMQMIFSEFGRTFESMGVKEVNAVGEKFDPTLHDAISKQASDEVEEGVVIQEWKSGYKLNERLLRPAVVVVSSGPETSDETELSKEEGAE